MTAPAMPFLEDAEDPQVTLNGFTLDSLAQFKRARSFPSGDSPDYRAFYVGADDVHDVLKYLLSRCSVSLKMNMFGYDDDELDGIIQSLVANQHVFVQGTLDKSQAGGVHEKKILAGWNDAMRASFVIGQSATHQISHTKGGVIDNVVAWEGSTNWSASGEGSGIVLGPDPTQPGGFKAQNNTLLVHTNPVEIAAFSSRLDEEHSIALKQMTGLSATAVQQVAAAG